MNGPTSFADLDRAISLFEQGKKPNDVSEQTGRPSSTCRQWRQMWKQGKLRRESDGSIMLNRSHYPADTQGEEPTDRLHKTEQDDEITLLSDAHEIRTVDDAIAKAGINPAEWQVASSTVSSYEVTIKKSMGKGKPDKIVKVPMWKVQERLKRLVPRAAIDAAAILFERFKAHKPAPPKAGKRAKRDSGYMLEVDLFDHHFGKLAHAVECGESYGLVEAEALYEWGVQELLTKFSSIEFDHAVLPIGQDMFHVNSDMLTTAGGTPQDTDSFLPQMFAAASMAVVRAIDLLLDRIGSVEVVEVPGNHGPTPTWFLAQFIRAWYRADPRVVVNTVAGYRPRKYVQWGTVMLGYTHGNEERHVELPNIMATEEPQMWAATKFREMHLGHYHKQKQTHFVGVDSHQGVTVRILQSLSATDRWHVKKGYVNSGNRACEGFAWHKERGLELHAKASL